MKRPATNRMIVGHPIIAMPLMLASAVTLIAGFQTDNLFPVFIAIAMIWAVQTARAQASAYRAWKAEWDAMGDDPSPRTATAGRMIGITAIATLTLIAFEQPAMLAYGAGFAIGWLKTQHGLVAVLGLLALALLARFIRRRPRRLKADKPVAVIAKAVLPVPSVADAYRALPPYCHALLRGQS
ncbi:MAG: hypothetical protein V4461_13135 [Pseudomonadota bacterium]